MDRFDASTAVCAASACCCLNPSSSLAISGTQNFLLKNRGAPDCVSRPCTTFGMCSLSSGTK